MQERANDFYLSHEGFVVSRFFEKDYFPYLLEQAMEAE
jgi:hypothetical protein